MSQWKRCSHVMPSIGRPVLVCSRGVPRVAVWNGLRWKTLCGHGLSGAIEFWFEFPELGEEISLPDAKPLSNQREPTDSGRYRAR